MLKSCYGYDLQHNKDESRLGNIKGTIVSSIFVHIYYALLMFENAVYIVLVFYTHITISTLND